MDKAAIITEQRLGWPNRGNGLAAAADAGRRFCVSGAVVLRLASGYGTLCIDGQLEHCPFRLKLRRYDHFTSPAGAGHSHRTAEPAFLLGPRTFLSASCLSKRRK